jgi:hypothetical protein
MNDISKRIEQEIGIPDLATILAERLGAADLNSLLLDVYRRRAERRSAASLLSDFKENRFVHLGQNDPRMLLEWDRTAFSLLPEGFVPVELSPLCPLGTNSVVATVSQNKSVVTTRSLEVVSDATNVLALECAVRRRALCTAASGSTEAVRLAASHRVMRPQFYANPHLLPHFRLFSLCSAGRDKGAHYFSNAALAEHVGFHLQALTAFLGESAVFRVAVTDLVSEIPSEGWMSMVLAPLREQFNNFEFCFDQSRTAGRGYYDTVCFKIHEISSEQPVELADGGSVDWSRKLLSNARERLFISGIGSERVCGLSSR